MKGENMHKKYAKITTAALFGALISGAASGCGQNYDLTMWIGFGSAYTTAANNLIDRYMARDDIDYSIGVETQGGYDKLQKNLNNSFATASYPNFSHGYPDHFAGYISTGVQVALDDYITAYDAKHGTNLLEDYYDDYMEENKQLKYRADGTPYIMGLPFNKSTELLGYNAYFLDYAKSVDSSITLPETWDGWAEVGPKMVTVMKSLFGKYLWAIDDETTNTYKDYKITTNNVAPSDSYTLLLDCANVNADNFKLMSWDSSDNMFITIVRQWGSVYTDYTSEDIIKYQHGWAYFNSDENKSKTIAAMEFFKDLYKKDVFGLPSNISSDSYSSTAFKNNQCMFVICSSGGLSYNVSEVGRFKLAPIPYKDADKKYVISQGTNLCLFEQGTEEDMQKSFDTMVAISTGELQSSWAAETGYYPSCKSATVEGTAYYDLLNSKQDSPTKIAYQDSAKLNEEVYMNESLNWQKFVDKGFVGSSKIRDEVETIMAIVFAGEKTSEQILNESMERLKTYDPKYRK